MGEKRCGDCGSILTAEEIEYYGVACNACEGKRKWDERCRDCDDTGITIQTERRCACQPSMTDKAPVTVEQGDRFLLVKRGLYYRPGNQGYTGIKDRAGRYPESDASPEDGITAIHEDDAPEYSQACFADLKKKHMLGKIAALEEEIKRLRERLRGATTALWAVRTGRIEGEPRNYRDTVQIMRDIAAEFLDKEAEHG